MNNHRHKHFFLLLLTCTLLILPNLVYAEAPQDVPVDKVWTISFNLQVDRASVTSNSIYVTNQTGDKVGVSTNTNGDKIIVTPPTGGYMRAQTYTLHITQDVKNNKGTSLKESVRKNFTIEDFTYDIVTIHVDGKTTVRQSFATYAQAIANKQADEAIQYGGALITMPAGIVVTKPTAASTLTNIYSSSNFKTADTYVTADTELEFVESTDAYVKIKVAGKTGFIRHENSHLIPLQAVKKRSYYSTSNGVLTHFIYSNKSGSYASYQAGKAPAFMTDGVQYYSWDSMNFYTANDEYIGTAYQYFQFLPARSKTQYTAEEIDDYIVNMLVDLERLYPNNPTYQNASKKSKLLGLGNYLKQVEHEQKVNALLILALAQHESTYGLSKRALEFNNLFGIKVFDDHPEDLYFKTVEANIDELLKAFFNKNYIPPNAPYANGAVFGNKSLGFNVKYASDPYWGAKAAGHMYRIDKTMGGKDLTNAHKIGLTTEALNVRIGAGTENALAFRYNKTGIPVIIKGPATPSPWLKIVSDDSVYDELFVHGDYVKEIPVVR